MSPALIYFVREVGAIAALREITRETGPLLILTIAEILAGLTLTSNIDLLASYPALLILIPGLMDLRGDVYGAIGYRLTTMLHIGQAEAKLKTKYNFLNALIGYTSTLVVTILLSSIISFLALAFSISSPAPISMLFIAMLSSLLTFAVLTPIVITSTIALYKKGVDPSRFVAIIVTGIGDALTPITLISVFRLADFVPDNAKFVIIALLVITLIISYAYLRRERSEKDANENITASLIASLGSSIGGLAIASNIEAVAKLPVVVGSLPAFNAVIGAGVGFLGNTLNIDLHVIGYKKLSDYLSRCVVLLPSVAISVLFASAAAGVVNRFSHFSLSIIIIAAALFIVYTISSVVTYYLTVESFRHGWNPDNLVFPLMTTFVDLNGPLTLSLLVALFK